jgi:hypothetical protein
MNEATIMPFSYKLIKMQQDKNGPRLLALAEGG